MHIGSAKSLLHGLSKHEPGQCPAYPKTNSDHSLQIAGMLPAPSSTVVLSPNALLSLSHNIHSATRLFPFSLAHLTKLLDISSILRVQVS